MNVTLVFTILSSQAREKEFSLPLLHMKTKPRSCLNARDKMCRHLKNEFFRFAE